MRPDTVPVPSSAIPLERDEATSFGVPGVMAWFHFWCHWALFATRETEMGCKEANVQLLKTKPQFLFYRRTMKKVTFSSQTSSIFMYTIRKRNVIALIHHVQGLHNKSSLADQALTQSSFTQYERNPPPTNARQNKLILILECVLCRHLYSDSLHVN